MSRHEEGLSTADLNRLCSLVYEQCGINLSSDKKVMLEVRLKKRLRSLDLSSYSEYCEYLFSRHGLDAEITHLIDAVTTNKTDFFRESAHFDFLAAQALPEFSARYPNGRKALVWSAGCSTGEEAYTLAIVLNEYAESHPGFRFNVLATDISSSVLAKAKKGVFNAEVVGPVPQQLRKKYFMRSRDPDCNLLRVVPELRELIEFRRLNLMDANLGLAELAEFIFCRNVVIYFDRPTQGRLFEKLARQLAPQGYLFIGHSETLHGMNLPLAPVAPALYRKTDERNRI
jgi:chemotaxis protein methyltransferase CheR